VPRTKKQRPSTLEQAFGQVLLVRREEKGFSQMDLAVAAGYSLRYMGDVERGAKSATMRTMNDLATLLGVSLGTLVVEAEELLNRKPKPTKKALHRTKGQ
jgi:transcriptional regulator with XRE-family HTH domain